MPWKSGDAKKHKKGLSSSQQAKWSTIANHVLTSTGNDAEAIRTANSRVGKKKKGK